jgi:peptide/nickel transport system substrate-binding protein
MGDQDVRDRTLAQFAATNRRAFLIQGGLAAGSLFVAACGGSSSSSNNAASGGPATSSSDDGPNFKHLALGAAVPFLSLDPHLTTGGERGPMEHMFEPLIHRKPDRSLVPALAASDPEQVAPRKWRVKLRSGRTFTDGKPITMDDVLFTFERIADPKFASPMKDYLGFIKSVKPVGKDEIEITTAVATDLLPERLPLARIVPKHVVTAKGNEEFGKNPEVMSGSMFNTIPFDNHKIELKRYDKYDGVLPVHVDAATWTAMPQATTQMAQLSSGQVSIIDYVPPSLYDTIKKNQDLELGVPPFEKTLGQQILMFNNAKKPFDDKRVRQAFMYAIDREQIIKVGQLGAGLVADSPLQANNPYYVEPTVKYRHDPEKAKALLAEAGYSNGVPFELIVSNFSITQPTAPLFEQQLKEAGFQPKLKIRGIDEYFSQVTAGNYQAFVFPIDFEVFSPDVDMTLRGWWGGFFNEQAAHWTTPEAKEIPKLLDQALAAQDDAGKKEAYGRAQQIIMEEAASLPIWWYPLASAWRKELCGYEMPFVQNIRLWDVQPC